MSRFITVEKQFFSGASGLRRTFDERFQNPLQDHADRYRWDYWHVPDQYTHLRTPAVHYFPKNQFQKFTAQLTRWGQENLGCHAISPPWLSCYVEGCEQKLHRDVPHGPFAFVYSISAKPNRDFSGGRTMIMHADDRGYEMKDQFHLVPPTFNQLLVFDPRFLHGVERVTGTQDPRLGRLVIHGWFTAPQPWGTGPLTQSGGFDPLYEWLGKSETLRLSEGLSGLLVLNMKISAFGRVSRVDIKQNTIYGEGHGYAQIKAHLRQIVSEAKKITFSKRKSSSQVVLPLIFD